MVDGCVVPELILSVTHTAFAETTMLQRQIQDRFGAKGRSWISRLLASELIAAGCHGAVVSPEHPAYSVPFLNVISSAILWVGL
jgi:hypothetical protein